jgi:hypothetical protein
VPREPSDADYDIEALAAALVGSTITGVRYWETPCFGEEIPDEWPAGGVHGVSHGVDLITGNSLNCRHLGTRGAPAAAGLLGRLPAGWPV